MTTPMRAAVCDAAVLMPIPDLLGDVHAGIELRCELAPHEGAHSHAMTACEPRAELTWFSEPDLSGSEES